MVYSQLVKPGRPASYIRVEYTDNGKRIEKEFEDVMKARRFYLSKDASGAEPRIVSAKN